MAIERDKELLVWSDSPESARRFFGQSAEAAVRELPDRPLRPYQNGLRLYAVSGAARFHKASSLK